MCECVSSAFTELCIFTYEDLDSFQKTLIMLNKICYIVSFPSRKTKNSSFAMKNTSFAMKFVCYIALCSTSKNYYLLKSLTIIL